MLTELRVRDLAVIGDVTLPLVPGLNVLTGETGAGKSLLIDALALLLGERASADLVRPGAARAVVEAVFDVPGRRLHALLERLGLDPAEGVLVVRRDINAEGRNRAWVNGSPTTVAALAELGRALLDLHGQHESQSLLMASKQRDILDASAGAAALRANVRGAHEALSAARNEELALIRRRDEVRKRADYLRHVANEIQQAAPRLGEDEQLAADARRLDNVEELTRVAHELGSALDGEEAGVLGQLGAASRMLDQLARLDPAMEKRWAELLDGSYAAVDELVRNVRAYAAGLETDPDRLAGIEHRRDVLFRLTQKYGPGLAEVIETGAQAAKELDMLDTAEGDIATAAERRAAAEQEFQTVAAELTATRKRAAKKLAVAVQRLFPGLGLPDGKFIADIQPAPAPGADGADVVTFLVTLNPGMDARPLAHVASGGELSRLMLALKVVLAREDEVPTLAFDEIDQGVGGDVAQRIAEALAEVAESRQVLVVTHLAPVAARAAAHVRVTKQPRGGVATADVALLAGEARVTEIARMLGDHTDAALMRHAESLLDRGSLGRRAKDPVKQT